jgi:hypothetical protein
MTTDNAVKKLERLTGEKVSVNDNGLRYVVYKGYYICFYNNGRYEPGLSSACVFHTQRVGSEHITYFDNITQAFNLINNKPS